MVSQPSNGRGGGFHERTQTVSLDFYLYVEVDTGRDEPYRADLFDANVTHNLGKMADAAGIYGLLWRPEENGIETAGQMIEPLRKAVADMAANPAKYQQHNPSNGWGSYEVFLSFVRGVLEACETHPKAKVYACR